MKTLSELTRLLLLYIVTPFAVYLLIRFARHVRFNYWVRTNPEFRKIPSLPRHWLLGNLINCGPKLDPGLNRHPDYGFEEIWNELGQPPCFWLDFSPVDITILVIADPELAEMVSEPRPGLKYSLPKSDTTLSLSRLLGDESMVLIHGEEWRTLRKRFNKGFAPVHLHSLSPLILDKTKTFIDRLKLAARNGTEFELCGYAQDLTTDIITMVSMERDFGAQTCPEGQGEKSRFGLLTTSRALSAQAFKVGQGFNALQYFDPVRPFLSWLNETTLNWRLYNLIQASIAESNNAQQNSSYNNKPARSIISLATTDLEPTPKLIKNTVSQIKTFLFAGQDTTATLIQWLLFELSKCANIKPFDPLHDHYTSLYRDLLREHDAVFGKNDPFSALDQLASSSDDDSQLTSLLPITNAWVKEALRLHPPASSARWAKPPPLDAKNPPIEIPVPGRLGQTETTAIINGLRIYNCHWLIQRHPRIWSSTPTPNKKNPTSTSNPPSFDRYDALIFNPNRFLDTAYMSRIPTGAFRPFERGPRNCVGQSLATLEAVVVLCAVARGLVFEKVGGGSGLVLTEGNGEREKEVVTTHRVTAVVGDGMRMRVRLRG